MHISKDSQSHTFTTILNYELKSLTSRGELPLVQVRNELVWRRFLSYTTPPSSFAKCYLSATSISRGSTPDSTRSMNLWDRHTPLEKEASKGTALRKRKRRKEVEEPKKKEARKQSMWAGHHHGGIEYESTRDYRCPCFDPTRPHTPPLVLYNGIRRLRLAT